MSRCRSLPNDIQPLILTLHEKLGIDRSAIWEEVVEELDSIDEVNMHDPVLEDARESDEPHESPKEMERLLIIKEGQGMTLDEMASALAGGVQSNRSQLCATVSTKTSVYVRKLL
jgi:hypothetical protein